jgi:5-methyltetrahydrofolate--homocysteine methyltransferase
MTTITGSTSKCTFGTGLPTVLGAMQINTLKSETLAHELIGGNLDIVKKLAEIQCGDGVGFLQVMVAHPEIDEEVMLPKVCKAAHDAVGLPLYIDTTNITAIRKTLDIYAFKPILSVNGDPQRLQPMLQLVRESGAAVICLCMDDHGIPATSSGRLDIAFKIVKLARDLHIPDEDIVIDPLVMASGVSEPDSMIITLEVLREIKQNLPFSTFLGIDNAGYGMPFKYEIDLAYLIGAIPAGLDAALLEPPLCSEIGREGLNLIYAANFITGRDPYAKEYLDYLRRNQLIKGRHTHGK